MPEAGAADDDRARPEPIEIALELASDTVPMIVMELGANRYRVAEDPVLGVRQRAEPTGAGELAALRR